MLEKTILDILNRERDDSTPLLVMMCGIAGSGKTTFSQKLEKEGFLRLSIDEEVWSTNGRYGIDYPTEKYREYLDEAHLRLRENLVKLIHDKQQVVVDSSFWKGTERDEFKQLIETTGGKWRLIYLKVDPNDLRKRLKIRSIRFDANAAFPISEEILTSFLNGFEAPKGEGEIVIKY
ncbi:AAA family ATPase [Peribacillus alkalitolerans]|uniref:AAA family ATPase n=1 Tax=Peribacillus alkalitolerans TaxID=1550385 RepID=UPI0013D60CE6|nr:ATP-binding protein [Peribacillus alkalitolerans]